MVHVKVLLKESVKARYYISFTENQSLSHVYTAHRALVEFPLGMNLDEITPRML